MLYHRIARHEFTASALAPDAFRVVDFEGDEAVSQVYRFEANLVSDDAEIAFADLIDKPATLTMYRGDEPAEVSGIVIDFEQAGMHHARTEYPHIYRAVLVPRLWRLGLSFQSRIFQNLTVEEIVGKILRDADIDFQFKLSASYTPRDYCTQYKETDLAFVQRLLEYEGIHYHFTHSEGAETLVLSDDASGAPPIDGTADLPYRHAGGLLSADSAEFVGTFVARQQLVTSKTEITDYNYRTPETPIRGASALNTEQAHGTESDYGTHAGTGARATALAKIRNQEIEATRLVMTGEGDCQRFRTGQRFALGEHYRESLNQTYLLTHVHHWGGQSAGASGDDTSTGYRNTFVCVPGSVAYRPPRLTPEPKLPGVLTARVESAGGDYAPVDDQGRYHVRMPFDIGDAGTAQASKAVRLAQPYSGPGYGQHFPVHKGAEMVIACVDGNVDRVLGLSTIYNPTQFSPVTSGNASQNVLRSWGKNELTFDDKKGAENIYMHGTKDHNVKIVNDENIHVGTNRTQQVGHDEALKVGHDQDQEIGNDQTLKVALNQSTDVGANRAIAVGANHDEDIRGAMTISVGSTMTESVGSAKTTAIGAAYSLSVGAVKSETVGGISSETVGGVKSVNVAGSISHKAGTTYNIDASGDYNLAVGKKAAIKIADVGTIQTGKDLTVKAGKKVVVEAADELTLKCGSAEIVMKKNGDISIKGGKINIKGSGQMTLKGSQIAAN